MTTPTPIPEAMIEAAAKVVWSRFTGLALTDWDTCCTDPDDWRDQVRPVLAAALSLCESHIWPDGSVLKRPWEPVEDGESR